jgi:DNA helicase II / ATP-dependent DNA helicase PcrA
MIRIIRILVYTALVKYLDGLNLAQRAAAMHTEGPLLVVAGAGAGKTRVVAHRILHIVAQGTAPERILAITFTNKAAREMRERVTDLLRNTPEITRPSFSYEKSPFVSTFHSLALAIIKENYRLVGFKRLPVIYDRADSLRTVKTALRELGFDRDIEPRMALGMISRIKGEGITLGEWQEDARNPRERAVAAAWVRYEAALAKDQALDFDDILARAVRFLENNPGMRDHYQHRWKYIHIDEYQDTNGIQARLSTLLIGPEHNICAVGDGDQCIYTWRGADMGNILSFEKKFPGAKVVLLEQNYRSTKTILAAANDIIKKNQVRVEKNLFTDNDDGAPVSYYQAWNEGDEAAFVARKIAEHIDEGAEPSDFAVLYRANFQSRAIEEALLGAGILYQVLGTRFFERAEVKDCLSLIRAALFGTAADTARAASNQPGIGKTTVLAMLSEREYELRGAAREKVAAFKILLSRIGKASGELVPSKFIAYVVRESGLEKKLQSDLIEGAERLDNLRELGALASRYDAMAAPDGLQQFLESAALASDQDELKEEQNAVRLMTVHASKGLEFNYVFITGLEEGLFPYVRDGEPSADKEEERRLMYVALTRARKKAFLSSASVRTVFGSSSLSEPSQFISDISPDLLEVESPERLGRTIYLD